ncbi:cytochrome c [Castellaniella ginsengisoli]|jgi:mono/diheme cytochrome c family protein|uniref:Mono/diheme cytochrome c family protein n=4 Tax=Alcaligenaceae TaxID=506 RepID=A0A366H3F5_9BURK|nr:cytochrome c [Eoetvoesiella caeni]MCI2810711.1 cytochrome c [Eoetvoesiella caeni]NYT55721.1 cytochrome c [Eoetvoesiella caeni]RBP36503.1 mono/diheme cytochrome c family protein [Eoetvoesiella caeni]
MSKKRFILGAVGVLVAGAAALLYYGGRDAGPAFIDPADHMLVVTGKAIYANNCAACHGEALQGQPNWRQRLPNGRLPAPPHDKTGHTWHHPDAMLFDMVKNGLVPGKTAPPGYESDMPAYAGILTDEEIVAVLAYIKSDWPPKVLQAQKEVTLQRRQ